MDVIMEEIVKTFSNLKSTHKYFCCNCNDTGKVETLRYTGKDLEYIKPNQEVTGYERIHRMCWNYIRSINPNIPEYGRFFFDNLKGIEEYCKTIEKYNPFVYIETVTINPCDQCNRGNWIKEKKEEAK